MCDLGHITRGRLTGKHNRIPVSSETDTIDPPKVPAPPPQRARGGHVPQKHLLVPADAGEASIVGSDGEVEDLIPVGRVRLNETVVRRGDLGRIVQPDGAVGGACEYLFRRLSAISRRLRNATALVLVNVEGDNRRIGRGRRCR